MALKDFSWERMAAAVEDVRERVIRASGSLRQAGIPHVVIGDHAVASWVARVDLRLLDLLDVGLIDETCATDCPRKSRRVLRSCSSSDSVKREGRDLMSTLHIVSSNVRHEGQKHCKTDLTGEPSHRRQMKTVNLSHVSEHQS